MPIIVEGRYFPPCQVPAERSASPTFKCPHGCLTRFQMSLATPLLSRDAACCAFLSFLRRLVQYILQLPSDQSVELAEGSRCSLLPFECVSSVLDVVVRLVSHSGPAGDPCGEASGRGVCPLSLPPPPRLPVLPSPLLDSLLRALRLRCFARLSRGSRTHSTQRLRLPLRRESALLRCSLLPGRVSPDHAAAAQPCPSSASSRGVVSVAAER